MSEERNDPLAGLTRSSAGGVTGEVTARGISPFRVAPTTGTGLNTFRDPLIPVACWRMDDIRFDFASSFLRPDCWEELTMLSVLRRSHPGAPLALFGHADPVGEDEFNKRLSGRRALAVYACLVREPDRWEQLFNNSEDKWGLPALRTMLERLGFPTGGTDAGTNTALGQFRPGGRNDAPTRLALYRAYMDAICRDIDGGQFVMTPADFLARGAATDRRGDVMGCGEFNPVLMFSSAENTAFNNQPDKTQRNLENAPNRRVGGLLFRPGTVISPSTWPCPAATAPTAQCRTRFFADHATRRQFQANRRTHEADRNTFACRFFDILHDNSGCEGATRAVVFQVIFQRFPGTGGTDADRAIANVPFTVRIAGQADRTGRTDATGSVTIAMAASATAVLEILGSNYILQPLAALENAANLDGLKRRLQILGHEVGAIDTTPNQATDRGVLNFQADTGVRVDGLVTPALTTAVQTAVRNAGGE